MRKPLLLLAALFLIAVAITLAALRQREPTYQGRPITAWISAGFINYGYVAQYGTDSAIQKANAAVLALGTNAIPFYLRLLNAPDDSPLKLKIGEWLDEHKLGLHESKDGWLHSSEIARGNGACGISILGTNARSAIPALTQLLNSDDEQKVSCAALTLPAIGLEGIPPLANYLAKPHAKQRGIVVMALQYCVTEDDFFAGTRTRTPEEKEAAANIVVPILIPLLKDHDEEVQLWAARDLGDIGSHAETTVPALIDAIKVASKSHLRYCYLVSLRKFGPEAKAAIPILTGLLHHPEPIIAFSASNAMMAIDPTFFSVKPAP